MTALATQIVGTGIVITIGRITAIPDLSNAVHIMPTVIEVHGHLSCSGFRYLFAKIAEVTRHNNSSSDHHLHCFGG